MKKSIRKSLPVVSILMGTALLTGFYVNHKTNTRQYISGIKVTGEEDNGAGGMAQYFFNARKNTATGKMDYKAMATANAAAQIFEQSGANSRVMAGLGMNWIPLGPSNIGGRTRGILIDNQDPTHNTLFACAVSGGIWRSKNGGGTWDSVPGNDQLSSMEACDIAQDKNGVLYVGTGEGFSLYSGGDGFSTSMIGGGIFKSIDDGNTWTVIGSTVPTANNANDNWAYVNRIAIDPSNPNYIYAATYGGLMVSQNGGTSWTQMLNTTNNLGLGGNSLDVKMSPDGSLMLAYAGGKGWYAYPNGSPVTHMTQLPKTVGKGGIYSGGTTRFEFAISPSNPDYAYVCVIINNNGGLGLFGTGATKGTGIFMTNTAKSSGNGGYWYDIGPGGSNTFNPYSSGGSQDQAAYDNALAVSPSNPGSLLVGGTTLWSWNQNFSGDTIGSWNNITTYFGYPGDPYYIHSDMHTIVFDPTNANVVYDGNDGGLYKSVTGGKTWAAINRNYDATQFNSISFAPFMSPVPNGYTVGEGVMGGTQDNGTPYIPGTTYYYWDAFSVGGGDGGRSWISQLSPNIFYASSDNNSLFRGGSLQTLGSEANAYTKIIGDSSGANIDSMSTVQFPGQSGCFYDQIAMYENAMDSNTLDSIIWIADSNYTLGHTIYPISPNGNIPFPYKLHAAVAKGDTIKVQDRVVAKLATGFNASNGVWLMMQAIDLTDVTIWMPIGGPLSKPDAFSGANDAVHALTFSPDGDALFVGTEGGQFFRFSNLDSIQTNRYNTGALYSVKPAGAGTVISTECRVKSKNLGNLGGDILSISVDPKNGNNVMVTLGNYVNTAHVYYSTNALSATPTFVSVQGNLPKMPVYSCVLDVLNSGSPNSALVGTERGIYSTTNISGGSWTYTNNGMANTLVADLKQQTLPPWLCNNAYNVYVGTHGRGAFVSNTFFKAPTGITDVASSNIQTDLKVYPNPMATQGTLEFTLPEQTANVTVNIYDISGRIVKTVAMDNQAPGEHKIGLNTEDFSQGTYIASVTGNNFRKSARFVVVK